MIGPIVWGVGEKVDGFLLAYKSQKGQGVKLATEYQTLFHILKEVRDKYH
jgi:hypothetical protein